LYQPSPLYSSTTSICDRFLQHRVLWARLLNWYSGGKACTYMRT